MSSRWIWTVILVVLAVVTMLIERGLVGGLIGSFFIVVALALWVIPGNALTGGRGNDPTINRVSRTVLGVGLGLLAAAAAALLLPPQYFSWLVIGVGILIIIWFIVDRVR